MCISAGHNSRNDEVQYLLPYCSQTVDVSFFSRSVEPRRMEIET